MEAGEIWVIRGSLRHVLGKSFCTIEVGFFVFYHGCVAFLPRFHREYNFDGARSI